MGRTYTPTFRLEMDGVTAATWDGKKRPTNDNLRTFVMDYAASLKLGGVNEHISKALGYIPYPGWARIVRQSNNEVVAQWKAGLFQVYP